MDKARSPEIFDKIAQSYDKINRILSCGADRSWRKTLSRHLPTKPHLEVLDLATGTGDQIVSISGAPAPTAIASQMYAQATMTKMIANCTQGGESIDKAIGWAASELEGFMRV